MAGLLGNAGESLLGNVTESVTEGLHSLGRPHLWQALSVHPAFLPCGTAVTVCLLGLVFFGAVRYYSDPCDRHPLATGVTVLSLTATLLVVLMLPLDVFAVSAGQLDLGAIRMRLDALERIYDGLYVLLLSFAFGAVPFAYFYVEEDDSDISGERSRAAKAFGALRCTLVVVSALVLLLLAGLLVRPSAPPTPSSLDSAWLRQLLDTQHGGMSVLNFAVAVLAAGGALVWLVYTAHGLVMLPASLCAPAPAVARRHHVRGTGADHRDDDSDDWELTRTRQKQQEIGQRYAGSGGRITRNDLGALSRLQTRSDAIGRAREDSQPGLVRRACRMSLKACRLLLGLLTGLSSALLLGSLLFVSVDRAMHSQCGDTRRPTRRPRPRPSHDHAHRAPRTACTAHRAPRAPRTAHRAPRLALCTCAGPLQVRCAMRLRAS
jgi:LMBR1 domain-containing protein 1